MNFFKRNPVAVFGLVLVWRVLLLVFTAQPIPANDAFGYDGPVVNLLHGGGYCNPSMAVIFPISGTETYSMYPPLYQAVLWVWMKLFGASVLSAMAMHLALFALAGFLVLDLVKRFFPAATDYALAALFFFGFTFGDRPESVAYVFGIIALGLVLRQLTNPQSSLALAAGLTVALLLALYTSVLVGAYFFGVGFLACAVMWLWRRNFYWFVPFVVAAALFALITGGIAHWEPRWWAGFMESARQQSVMGGFHAPRVADLLKVVRTAPVFFVALAIVPLVIARRQAIFSEAQPWLALCSAIFLAGWGLLAADLVVLAANYVMFVLFSQILLAAGLLALMQKYFPQRDRLLRGFLLGAVLLVSVRAVGLTTWGTMCAMKNSYGSTQTVLRQELTPFAKSDQVVLISSAFLYTAVDIGVRKPVHSDWYFDHTLRNEHTQMDALVRLRPAKLILTQFDYYRQFEGVLKQLQQRPEVVELHERNLAKVRPPDAVPSLQRVVQHVSWAPVIVDLDWKQAE